MSYDEKSLEIHKEKNVLRVVPNVELKTKDDLSTYYTPGIAAVSKAIAQDPNLVFDYTIKRNTVAVVSDGSAVLGLGNIGPEGALPVMEGKSILFSEFAEIDAFPICLSTHSVDGIVSVVKDIATSFGGINLEDIAAPKCFEIEEKLQNLGIPVMHDDQHGTAVVVLAGLINALKVAGKTFDSIKIVISGAGAAGIAIAKMILEYSDYKTTVVMLDSKGIISKGRSDLNSEKREMVRLTKTSQMGTLADAVKGADVFIGVSAPNILSKDMVQSMAQKAIVFAMANPVPEIDPKLAAEAGAYIVATGRSDYPNQINNVLAFPGIFRGALDVRAKRITSEMLFAAARALAEYVHDLSPQNIIPPAIDRNVAKAVAEAVRKAAKC